MAFDSIVQFELWLACHTQEQIAEIVGSPRQTIADQTSSFAEIGHLTESGKTSANHLADFDHPIYNLWKQRTILCFVFWDAVPEPRGSLSS
ncbi:MAG: hypothetical protein JRK53_01455 [Deltaproteobacteria bacterium]|nr:hypothetical protein [Deltaproteobacteria bacterium]MBW1815786.1 hypothetical protein [Deltaproteobacteria bacterium]